MKIQPVSFAKYNLYRQEIQSSSDWKDCYSDNLYSAGNSLSCMPCYYPISFTGIQNSSKLRILFAYRLPCIYCGVPMIDPKVLSRWLKNGLFKRSALEVINALEPYKDSFVGMEAKVLELITERAKIHPKMNIREILQEVKPVYTRRLRKKQTPIFHELTEASYDLPPEYRHKFKLLMEDTEKKLDEKPIVIPFSSYEFKYKLAKIREDIAKGSDLKSKKVMNKIMKETKRFSNTTSASTIERQKQVLGFIEHILKKSVLKNNNQLKSLIETSKSRLNREEIIVPFTRKTFLYDLLKILDDLPNKKLYDKMFTIAQKLPTSQESFSAYVLKIAHEQPEKIGHRIVWPSLASVEHLLPRSCGGADMMANFAGATTRENSDRKSIEFRQQLKLRPNTPMYCQWYVNRLIELYHQGIFARHNISPKYITDFADTIYTLSNHKIKLNTSKLKTA